MCQTLCDGGCDGAQWSQVIKDITDHAKGLSFPVSSGLRTQEEF